MNCWWRTHRLRSCSAARRWSRNWLGNSGFMRGDRSRVAAVADQLPIPRLLALLQRSLGCLSVDTGPAHAAAAVGCPLTVLFGTTDPRLYRPRSATSPVQVTSVVPADVVPPGKEAWRAVNSMTGISPDMVLADWHRCWWRRRTTVRPHNHADN